MAQPSGAASRVLLARTTAATTLPSATTKTTVQSLTLTGGPWTIIAKGFIVDLSTAESDFFRCELFNATSAKHLDVSAAWVSDQMHGNMITNIAKLTVAAGATVTIQQRCWHDHNGISQASVDPGATLLAFKAPSADKNRLFRSTASAPLPLGFATVASLGLTAGTWVFGFKATAVNVGTDSDVAQCGVPGTDVYQDVGTNPGWPRVATFTAFGVVNANTSTTITVQCGSRQGGPVYLDPGLVLWARQVPSAVTGSSCGTILGAATTTGAVADMRISKCTIGVGTGASQMGGTAITPGTWVVLGAEQADLSTSFAGFVNCRATNPGTNKVLDAHADVWLPFMSATTDSFATTTYLGKVTTSVNTAVEFRCGIPSGFSASGSSYFGGYVVFKP
jgi:hypothetical protein